MDDWNLYIRLIQTYTHVYMHAHIQPCMHTGGVCSHSHTCLHIYTRRHRQRSTWKPIFLLFTYSEKYMSFQFKISHALVWYMNYYWPQENMVYKTSILSNFVVKLRVILYWVHKWLQEVPIFSFGMFNECWWTY